MGHENKVLRVVIQFVENEIEKSNSGKTLKIENLESSVENLQIKIDDLKHFGCCNCLRLFSKRLPSSVEVGDQLIAIVNECLWSDILRKDDIARLHTLGMRQVIVILKTYNKGNLVYINRKKSWLKRNYKAANQGEIFKNKLGRLHACWSYDGKLYSNIIEN